MAQSAHHAARHRGQLALRAIEHVAIVHNPLHVLDHLLQRHILAARHLALHDGHVHGRHDILAVVGHQVRVHRVLERLRAAVLESLDRVAQHRVKLVACDAAQNAPLLTN